MRLPDGGDKRAEVETRELIRHCADTVRVFLKIGNLSDGVWDFEVCGNFPDAIWDFSGKRSR